MWMACEWMFGDARQLNPQEHKGFKTPWHSKVELSFGVPLPYSTWYQLRHFPYECLCLHKWSLKCFFPPLFLFFFDQHKCARRPRACVYAPQCVCVRTLDHQLISHAGRHQRGLELTLRVGAAPHGTRNFTSPPLQQRQTYMAPIHIEMSRWSCAMCRVAIARSEEIKLQKSGDTPGSVCRWVSPRVAASRLEVFCVGAKCRYHVFFLLKQASCVSITALSQKPAPFLLD